MGRRKHAKSLNLHIVIEEEEATKFVLAAHALYNTYLGNQNKPSQNFDTFVMGAVVEKCNAIFKFHNEQLEKANQQDKENKKVEVNKSEKEEASSKE